MANGKLLNSYRVTYERLPNSLWKTNGWFSSGYRMTNVKLLKSYRITNGKLPNCCGMTASRPNLSEFWTWVFFSFFSFLVFPMIFSDPRFPNFFDRFFWYHLFLSSQLFYILKKCFFPDFLLLFGQKALGKIGYMSQTLKSVYSWDD